MKRGFWMCMAAALALCGAALPASAAAAASPGEEAFMTHCAVCHPNGENVITPDKTLGKKALAAGGIKTAADIVEKMRKPGPGMTPFDKKTLPDATANAVADYILKTFK
jgi:cytochrome c6